MIGYASRTGKGRTLEGLRRDGWRLLVSAKGRLRTEGMPYALDNGAWWAWRYGHPFDVAAFMRALDRLGAGADWIVVPDILAGGKRSLDFSLSWLDVLRAYGRPLLLPVQDGLEPGDVLPHLRAELGIFVGGSTTWKLDTLSAWGETARRARCYLHVGRVNTVRRVRLCAAAGADSFDGSSVARYAVNIPRLTSARGQPDLFAGAR